MKKHSILWSFFLLWALLPAPALAAQEDEEEESSGGGQKLAEIEIGGEIQEGVEDGSGLSFAFGPKPKYLQPLLRRISKAAKDPQVVGMLLKVDSPAIGMAKVAAIRGALEEFKAAGKEIHVHLEQASTREYLLASVAADVSMVPSGYLIIPGLRIEMSYMKDLLDWAGIQADVIHIGEFKTAFENLYRRDMSPGQREALGAILDGFYEDAVSWIAKDRRMDASRVKAAIDVGMFTAGQAKARGLLDHLEYEDQFRARLKQIYGTKVEVTEKYGSKKRKSLDFNDFTAIFQIFAEMAKKPEKPKGDKIAVVYAVGPISTGKSESSPFGGQVMGSRTMVDAIREAANDSTVKAVVLRVDSPGGSGLASDEIWREVTLAKAKKPFVVSMSDVAGSGGYYIAMAADAIVAEPGTITGSIGVIGFKPVLGGLYQKIGINTQVIQRGKNAGLFSLSTPFNEEERTVMTRLLESFYHDFVSKVSEGRKRPFEEMEKIARGRIWTGRQAKEIGLVDELGGLDEAVRIAKKKAGMAEDQEVPLLDLPRPKTFFEMLEEGFDLARMEAGLLQGEQGLLLGAVPDLARAYRFLYQLSRIEDRCLYLMPVELRWN